MEIIQSLGLNETVVYQFVIFAFTLIALSQIAFKPYLNALELRESKTSSSEEKSLEIQQKALELQKEYEQEARKISVALKAIFDEQKLIASKESAQLLLAAKQKSLVAVQSNKELVDRELKEASSKLKAEIPSIAQLITQKLLLK
jgi:F0F1-type ATP synthase membrane subunit b/b'